MSSARKSKKRFTDFVRDAEDGRVACYQWGKYEIKTLKAPSLAWLVQIAVRRDMWLCGQGDLDLENPIVQLQGYSDMFPRLADLKQLIRKRHLIDEIGLASIGMTLFDFPTLSHFFVVPKEQSFVREATVRDLRDAISNANDLVRHGRLAAYVPGHPEIGNASEEQVATLINEMTLPRLNIEAGLNVEDISKERFFLVDMAAPVQILTKQFLEVLDRQPKLKRNPYADWEEYGILSFMDLSQWEKDNGLEVKPRVRVKVIYSTRGHGYKTTKIQETTQPHIDKIMDSKGPVFRGLLADASEEFRQVIALVRGDEPFGENSVAGEALARWFPRTFPYNVSDFERAAQIFPEKRGKIQWFTGLLEKDGRLNLPIAERIRTMPIDTQGTAMLRAMKELESHDADVVSTLPGEEGFPRLCPDDDVYDCNNTQPEGRRYQPGWSQRDTDLLKEVMTKMGLPCPTEPLPVGADPRILAAWTEEDLKVMNEMFADMKTSLETCK